MPWDPLNAWPAGRRWLWAALAALVCLAQGPAFLGSLRPDRGVVVDFFRNWSAARYALDGLPVYTDQEVALERYLGARRNADDGFFVERFTHPPAALALALPLAGLDYPDATLAWNLLSLAALGASLWLVGRALGMRFALWMLLPLATLLLVCHPLREQLIQGQLNLVLLLLVTGVWVAERSGRPWWAGVLLGVATALKLFPAFLFLYFALRGRWKVVAAGALGLAALTGLTVALLGPQTYRSYAADVLPHLGECRGFGYNASLAGLWTKLFNPGTEPIAPLWQSAALAQIGTLASCAAVVAVLAWVVRRARSRAGSDQAFGLAVTAMLLVSPVVWHHYFLLLLLPLALVWVRLPPTAAARTLFLLTALTLWLHPMLWWQTFVADGFPGGVAGPVHTLTVLSLQCYALLGLFAFGVAAVRRAERIALEEGRAKGAPRLKAAAGVGAVPAPVLSG